MYRFALERPVSTLVGVATLVALGAFSLARLPVALLPDVERPRIEVVGESEGRSQEEMLHAVTIPFERRITSLQGVTSVVSETEDGRTTLSLDTQWQTDADRLRIELARRLEGAAEIPLSELRVSNTGGDASPILQIAIQGGSSGAERASYVSQILVPELARCEGAGQVDAIGLTPLHAVVTPRAADLAARALGADELLAELDRAGREIEAGRAREGAAVRPLVVVRPVGTLGALKSLAVRTPKGLAPLSDLAAVTLREIQDGTSYRLDLSPAVLVRLFRATGGNGVALSRAARRVLSDLAARPRGSISVSIVDDRSLPVLRAIQELGAAGLLGVMLGTLLLFLVLGRLSTTLALAAVVPASIVASFAAFQVAAIPLDVISLAGVALATGMLVDASIVVLEAIESARERGATQPAVEGTGQVATAVVAGVLAMGVVFLPLLYLRGLARAFFSEQAFAVMATLGASLLFSLTLTPVLSGRSKTGAGRSLGRGTFLAILDRTLARPGLVACFGALLSAASVASLFGLPRELMPQASSRTVEVTYRLPAELGREECTKRSIAIEQDLLATIDRDRVARMSGQQGEIVRGSVEAARGRVTLDMRSERDAAAALPKLRARLAQMPGVDGRARLRPGPMADALGLESGDLQIVVSAARQERAVELAGRVSAEIERKTGVRPEMVSAHRPRPATVLHWNEERLASLALTRSALESQVRAGLGGALAGHVEIPSVEPRIELAAATPYDLASLPLLVTTAAGRRSVPLAALARISSDARPALLWREEGRPALRLTLPASRRLDALDVDRLCRGLVRAADQDVHVAGEALEITRSFRDLALALGLSLLLVYLTIAALYESLVLPPLVMTTVPVAFGGGLTTLLVSGQSLNLMSFIGLIVLGGIVVNNAIVLVDRVEQLRRAGVPEPEALRRAASERYRPILLTTATTLLGMLPLIFLGGEGTEIRRALATTVAGGLGTSTFASLLMVPALHSLLDRVRRPRPMAA